MALIYQLTSSITMLLWSSCYYCWNVLIVSPLLGIIVSRVPWPRITCMRERRRNLLLFVVTANQKSLSGFCWPSRARLRRDQNLTQSCLEGGGSLASRRGVIFDRRFLAALDTMEWWIKWVNRNVGQSVSLSLWLSGGERGERWRYCLLSAAPLNRITTSLVGRCSQGQNWKEMYLKLSELWHSDTLMFQDNNYMTRAYFSARRQLGYFYFYSLHESFF